jgi:hypothetical protein
MNAQADEDPETLRISIDTKATVNVGNTPGVDVRVAGKLSKL